MIQIHQQQQLLLIQMEKEQVMIQHLHMSFPIQKIENNVLQ
jgi:hypothetical protein